jgi:hypothetical protein
VFAVAAALAGCASADAMASQSPGGAEAVVQPPALGLYPGETMAFEVHLAGVLAGEAQVAVGEVGDVNGVQAIVVKSRAATAGAVALVKAISDEATTVIDVVTGRPLSLSATLSSNGKVSTAAATFAGDGKSASVTYRRPQDTADKTTIVKFGDREVYDAHTAMAAMRGWRAQKGAQRTVWVIGGRRLWRIDMTYSGEETIGSALGNRPAIVLDGKGYRARGNMAVDENKPGRTFRVWLSDDADRVPLKVTATTELGEVVMDLTEYQRP